METIRFKPQEASTEDLKIPQMFYQDFADVTVFLFSCIAISGCFAINAVRKSIVLDFSFTSIEQKHKKDFLLASTTALISLVGAIVTAAVGGK